MSTYDNEYRARAREYGENHRARKRAGTVGPDTANHCLICDSRIPTGYTVCGPGCGAILEAQFDTWRGNGGLANVFGRYHRA